MKKFAGSYGPFIIVIAAVLWSMDGLLRRNLYSINPLVIIFLEHLIGFIFLSPFFIKNISLLKKFNRKTLGAFVWITLLSSILGTLMYTAAIGMINYIQFSVVVLLQQMQPVFAVFFGFIILREKIEKKYFLIFFASILCAYLISFPNLAPNFQTGDKTFFAALLAVGAAFSWGSSTAFSRYTLIKFPSLFTTSIRFGLASVSSFVLILFLNLESKVSSVSSNDILSIIVISLTTGMVALSIYYKGLKTTPVKISAICELAWPVSAIAIDYFYFNKILSTTQIIGTVILFIIILYITKNKKINAELSI